MKKSHFRYWELALLLALAVTILWGAASLGQQEELGRKVIRLHVIANSDSPEDQALKLRVRDRVLARAQEILEQSADMEQAEQALTAALPELTREARETLAAEGCAQPVQARLEPAEFPTKDYDGFSLPAGKYLALRVIIGQGAGQNWWCVVFPPLCTAAACQWQDAGRAAGLEEDDLSLMAEEDAGYELRFRSVELWEMLRQWLGNKGGVYLWFSGGATPQAPTQTPSAKGPHCSAAGQEEVCGASEQSVCVEGNCVVRGGLIRRRASSDGPGGGR